MRIAASTIAAFVLKVAQPATGLGVTQLSPDDDGEDDNIGLETMLPPSVQLAMDTPCVPDVSQLKEVGLLNQKEAPKTLPKFFMYTEGAFDFSNITACFMREVGNHDWVDDLDKHVLPNIAEHLTDFRLLGRLKSHPSRTMNTSEADFFIVGTPIGTSYHAGRLPSKACGYRFEHSMRMRKLSEALQALPTFQEQASRFVMIDTDWNWFDIVGPDALELIKKKNIILATADLMIASYGKVKQSNVVTIPYKAHYFVEDAAFAEQSLGPGLSLSLSSQSLSRADIVRRVHRSRTVTVAYNLDEEGRQIPGNGTSVANAGAARLTATNTTLESRKVSFAFHGLMGRTNMGKFRHCMHEMSAMLPATSVQDMSFYSYHQDEFAQIASDTAETLLKSMFCFVPAGDTPSSRRLFDALAAGCVPIIFNKLEDIAPNLPFRHTVDWPSIAVFAGDIGCVASHIGSVVFWLQKLLDARGFNAWSVEVMRQNGRKVFRDWMSYRSSGIATAFLTELAENRGLSI